jgi:hypothetical protein
MKLPVEIFRYMLKWNEEWWLHCTNHETQKYRLIHLKKIKSILSLVPVPAAKVKIQNVPKNIFTTFQWPKRGPSEQKNSGKRKRKNKRKNNK